MRIDAWLYCFPNNLWKIMIIATISCIIGCSSPFAESPQSWYLKSGVNFLNQLASIYSHVFGEWERFIVLSLGKWFSINGVNFFHSVTFLHCYLFVDGKIPLCVSGKIIFNCFLINIDDLGYFGVKVSRNNTTGAISEITSHSHICPSIHFLIRGMLEPIPSVFGQ